MSSNKFAAAVTAVAAILAVSACSKKGSSAAPAQDSAVTAEQNLNKAGCSFGPGPQYPTMGGESEVQLNCKDTKDKQSQALAIADYTTAISSTMKQSGRQDLGQLQVKMNLAQAKLGQEGDVDSPTEGFAKDTSSQTVSSTASIPNPAH
jgi:hypothetical protein